MEGREGRMRSSPDLNRAGTIQPQDGRNWLDLHRLASGRQQAKSGVFDQLASNQPAPRRKRPIEAVRGGTFLRGSGTKFNPGPHLAPQNLNSKTPANSSQWQNTLRSSRNASALCFMVVHALQTKLMKETSGKENWGNEFVGKLKFWPRHRYRLTGGVGTL